MNEEKSLREEIAEVKRLVNDIAQRMNAIINNPQKITYCDKAAISQER